MVEHSSAHNGTYQGKKYAVGKKCFRDITVSNPITVKDLWLK